MIYIDLGASEYCSHFFFKAIVHSNKLELPKGFSKTDYYKQTNNILDNNIIDKIDTKRFW